MLRPAQDPPKNALKPGEVVEVAIAKAAKMKLCWIPEGKATLGDPAVKDNKVHEYASKGFWMSKYTVTQQQWEAVMGDKPSWFGPVETRIKAANIKDTSRFPVDSVSWDDGQDFLTKVNKQATVPASLGRGKFVLPHEDEWEYACRGGLGNRQKYYWGNALNGDKANCNGTVPEGLVPKGPNLQRTTEVGSYERAAPHPWGLCDMHGNLWQWCENKYNNSGIFRTQRGGAWNADAGECCAAYRSGYSPHSRGVNAGLRVCFRAD